MPFEQALEHAAAVHHKNYLLRQEIKANRKFISLLLERLGGTIAISAQTLEQLPDCKINITQDLTTDAYIITCQPILSNSPEPKSTDCPNVVPIAPTDGAGAA